MWTVNEKKTKERKDSMKVRRREESVTVKKGQFPLPDALALKVLRTNLLYVMIELVRRASAFEFCGRISRTPCMVLCYATVITYKLNSF